MDGNETKSDNGIQRLESSFKKSSSLLPDQQQQQQKQQQNQPFVMNQLEIPKSISMPDQLPNIGSIGIPLSHPRIPVNRHRSLSQPSFFALDSLPPNYNHDLQSTGEVLAMEKRNGCSDSLLPPPSPNFTRSGVLKVGESSLHNSRKSHRRSYSDISFGFSTSIMQESHGSDQSAVQLVKKKIINWEKRGETNNVEQGKSEGGIVDYLFNIYTNLDNITAIYSSTNTTDDEKLGNEDWDNRASVEGDNDIVPTTRLHHKSVSVDSDMAEKMNFAADESPKIFPSPSPPIFGQLSPTNSIDHTDSNALISLKFNNREFTNAELKKIMADDRLSKIAINDPKRAKRMLSNRESAARSKDRKMRYIAELEHKVQTLQTKATMLSTELTMLQSDTAGLTSHNNELKFHLQSMNQQSQLREALDETLTAEIQSLKHATATSKFSATFSQPSNVPVMPATSISNSTCINCNNNRINDNILMAIHEQSMDKINRC